MKNLSEDNWYPSRDSNRSRPEYKSEALPPEPVCTVIIPIIFGEGYKFLSFLLVLYTINSVAFVLPLRHKIFTSAPCFQILSVCYILESKETKYHINMKQQVEFYCCIFQSEDF
jgi:hypothetical protein